jgi:hypothetical protein
MFSLLDPLEWDLLPGARIATAVGLNGLSFALAGAARSLGAEKPNKGRPAGA